MEQTEWRGKSPQVYKEFTCTWYATKKSLLLQGKRSKEIKDKLKHALGHPIPLTAAEDESKHSTEMDCEVDEISKAPSHSSVKEDKDTKFRDKYEASEAKEARKFNETEFHDGIIPGKTITNLFEFSMRKWVKEGARITITTPFLDGAGLKFILSCIKSESALDKIYTREICGWNNKKVDRVITEAELPRRWIVNKMVAIKKAPSFHAKFLAGEYKDKVELILTSCNFTSEHLFSEQLESVMRLESSVEAFHSDWLRPLEIIAEEEGNMARFLNMDDMMQEVRNIE